VAKAGDYVYSMLTNEPMLVISYLDGGPFALGGRYKVMGSTKCVKYVHEDSVKLNK
jgi:hypothetical protein